LAGGHNGLSNSEDPEQPQNPYERLVELRKQMNAFGLNQTPIVMAGGVWNLSEWDDYIDNPEIGPIAFQLGTRPLLTKESPVVDTWYNKLMSLKKGDVVLQQFSPTGFYSSAIRTRFLQELLDRKETEIPYKDVKETIFVKPFKASEAHTVFLTAYDVKRAEKYIKEGLVALRTPDSSLIFVSPETKKKIDASRAKCVGCLSQCLFSAWSQADGHMSRLPDPRSFCISATLDDVAHGKDVEDNLMFAGHSAYRFAQDPMYKNGFIPTVKELIDALLEGK